MCPCATVIERRENGMYEYLIKNARENAEKAKQEKESLKLHVCLIFTS